MKKKAPKKKAPKKKRVEDEIIAWLAKVHKVPKRVVLHRVGIHMSGDQLIGDRQAEFVAGYARLIAEIRARQLQAKILLSPPFPRGQLRPEEWQCALRVVGSNRTTSTSAFEWSIAASCVLQILDSLHQFCAVFRRELGRRQPIRRLVRIERKTRNRLAHIDTAPIRQIRRSEWLAAFRLIFQCPIKIGSCLVLTAEFDQLVFRQLLLWRASGCGGRRRCCNRNSTLISASETGSNVSSKNLRVCGRIQ